MEKIENAGGVRRWGCVGFRFVSFRFFPFLSLLFLSFSLLYFSKMSFPEEFMAMASCIDVTAPAPAAPAPPPLPPALPTSSLLMRQIPDRTWVSGEDCLRANPDLNEILVFSHHWHEGSYWDYKVVRVGVDLERQTWLNGELVGAYVWAEPPEWRQHRERAETNAALRKAALDGDANEVRRLLQQDGCDPNSADASGVTPLQAASFNGHVDVVKTLVATAATAATALLPNKGDCYGVTALHKAVFKGNIDIVQDLLTLPNIDVNLADSHGVTALHRAAYQGHSDVLGMLLQVENINVNAADKLGATALHKAGCMGHVDCVHALLQVPSINVSACDISNHSA